MRVLALLVICAIAMTLTGCLVPEGPHVISGQTYSRESIAFLDLPGVTRQETISTLGLPFWESKEARVLLYSWVSAQEWAFVPPENWADVGIRESEKDIYEKRWALLVAYDEAGNVKGHTIRRIGMNGLEEACVNWSREVNKKL